MSPNVIVAFIVHGLPETKGSWRAIGGGKMKRDNPREAAWATAVGWSAKMAMAGRAPYDGHVHVGATFVLPEPKGKLNRRDIDKLARSVLDAMNKIVYVDDELVHQLEAEKLITTSAPCAIITVSRATRRAAVPPPAADGR